MMVHELHLSRRGDGGERDWRLLRAPSALPRSSDDLCGSTRLTGSCLGCPGRRQDNRRLRRRGRHCNGRGGRLRREDAMVEAWSRLHLVWCISTGC